MTDLGLSLVDNAPAPYPGLRPFRPEESSIFCGREAAIDDVIARLGARNLVLVHGGSGCGKSSLVRAGVLPLLARQHELASRGFGYAIIRPSEGPLTQLATVLAQRLGNPEDMDAAAEDPVRWWTEKIIFDGDIVTHLEAAIERKGLQSFVLIVDQFEEIFPWTRDHGRSDVDLLVNFLARVGAREVGRRMFVLATMRSDYIGPCAQFAKLGPLINDCQYFLQNIDDTGIASAIVEPAAMFGGTIDPPLLRHLMVAAATQTDPLPVLQHGLMRMAAPYLGKSEWQLTLKDLDRVSTGGNALSIHANEVLASIADEQSKSRKILPDGARWIFRALFELDVGGKAIRRPRAFAKLVEVAGLPEPYVAALVAAFRTDGANLLTDTGGRADTRMIDISHEALLRNWDRMTGVGRGKQGGWIREEFEDSLTWRMLARYANDDYAVLDARTLAEVGPFLENMRAAPERARRYLLRASNQDTVRDEPEWSRVEELIARTRRKVMGWALLIVVLIALALGGVIYAWIQQSSLQRIQRDKLETTASSAVVAVKNAEKELDDLQRDVAVEPTDPRVTAQRQIETATTDDLLVAGAASGLIWTGNAKVTNLRDLLGLKVTGSDAAAGRHYIVTQPVKLRAETADFTGKRIGAVKRNTTLLALANGATAPDGQNWLKIRSMTLPTLYIQYHTSSSAAALNSFRRALSEKGFIVPDAQVLPQAANLREVRFCYAEDAALAADVANAVASTIGGTLPRVKSLEDKRCQQISKRGTIELWLGSIARQ